MLLAAQQQTKDRSGRFVTVLKGLMAAFMEPIRELQEIHALSVYAENAAKPDRDLLPGSIIAPSTMPSTIQPPQVQPSATLLQPCATLGILRASSIDPLQPSPALSTFPVPFATLYICVHPDPPPPSFPAFPSLFATLLPIFSQSKWVSHWGKGGREPQSKHQAPPSHFDSAEPVLPPPQPPNFRLTLGGCLTGKAGPPRPRYGLGIESATCSCQRFVSSLEATLSLLEQTCSITGKLSDVQQQLANHSLENSSHRLTEWMKVCHCRCGWV